MKKEFTPGTIVRFKLRDGSLGSFAVITDETPDRPGWTLPGYAGEGYYFVETRPDRRRLIADEDDLVLVDPKEM